MLILLGQLELEMQHLQQQLSTAKESHAMQQRMLQDANGTSLSD